MRSKSEIISKLKSIEAIITIEKDLHELKPRSGNIGIILSYYKAKVDMLKWVLELIDII